MRITRIVTLAKMYDFGQCDHVTKTLIGRCSRHQVERKIGGVCVSAESVKAVIIIPDEIVEKYATIEAIKAPAAEVAEND